MPAWVMPELLFAKREYARNILGPMRTLSDLKRWTGQLIDVTVKLRWGSRMDRQLGPGSEYSERGMRTVPVRYYSIPVTSIVVDVSTLSYARMFESSREADSADSGNSGNSSRQYSIGGTISESVRGARQ